MRGDSPDNLVAKFTITELLHDKEFNKFLDGLIKFPEVVRITLANHLIEAGWDDCDVDLDIELKGGSCSPKLNIFLSKYRTVKHIWVPNKKTGKPERNGDYGKFRVVGKFYLEISWGHKPYTVPYLVLRDKSIKRKKHWLK